MSDGRVIVVGSINLDVTLRCDRLPSAGETVLASSESRGFGGKGANQAVAAAASGAVTYLVGGVGDDVAGAAALDDLTHREVRTDLVIESADYPTGTAYIAVSDRGENNIIVSLGANAALHGDAVRESLKDLGTRAGDVILVSAEIPESCAEAAAEVSAATGATLVYNVAPFRPLGEWVAHSKPILVLNEVEATQATGQADPADALTALAGLANAVVVTQGADGVLLTHGEGAIHVPSVKTQVVDTTGAGDAFCGALVASLAAGQSLERAVEAGVALGALAVGITGARVPRPTGRSSDQT